MGLAFFGGVTGMTKFRRGGARVSGGVAKCAFCGGPVVFCSACPQVGAGVGGGAGVCAGKC